MFTLFVIPLTRPEIAMTAGGLAVTHSNDFSLVCDFLSDAGKLFARNDRRSGCTHIRRQLEAGIFRLSSQAFDVSLVVPFFNSGRALVHVGLAPAE